jgi:hypothetical protein
MTNTQSLLDIRMGPRALAHIRENGLRAEDVCIVPGAAGGPKGLGLAKLDEWLFADWLPTGFSKRNAPIDLIGASIGAWRFASACRGVDSGVFSSEATREGLRDFTKHYSETKYPPRVNAAYISGHARELITHLFSGRVEKVLAHPHYRLNVLAVRGKGILAREARGRTHAGYALATLANAFGREHLRHFMDRTWFHAHDAPLLFDPAAFASTPREHFFDRFRTEYAPLTQRNFDSALIATGSIPLVLEGVAHIEGASEGTYWDGGIIDYHLHLPYAKREGIVLYPHFTNKIIPGWLDKALPWRRARDASLDNVVLISPSREYLDQLPLKKLPDRNDFARFQHDYEGRVKYWRFAMDESARLRDALANAIERGELHTLAKPL